MLRSVTPVTTIHAQQKVLHHAEDRRLAAEAGFDSDGFVPVDVEYADDEVELLDPSDPSPWELEWEPDMEPWPYDDDDDSIWRI